MIDFVRINYKDKSIIEPFVCNKENFEELHTVLEYHSGEIKYPYSANIGCMDIGVNDKSVYVKNSIHKLYNELQSGEAHNYNDFKYSALCSTISYLDGKLTDVKNTRLTQLEFGLNIKLPIPAEKMIIDNIMLHKLELHNHSTTFDGNGQYKQFDYHDYYLKIYDKAMHYGVDENIIRFEVKHKTSKSFNPLGAFNIHDLKSKTVLQNLFDDLLKRFDELTIVDNIPTDSTITIKDKRKLESYLSYNYWSKHFDRKDRNLKGREKKAFERLLVKNDLLKTKASLRASLIQKFTELLNS